MKIDLNKDFETQFKSESWKGFSSGEVVCGGIALGLAAIVVFTVWNGTGLPINVCVYFGIPVMVPVVALGLLKYQGHTMADTAKEVLYFMKTRELGTEMEEMNPKHLRIFSMQHVRKKGKREANHNGSI